MRSPLLVAAFLAAIASAQGADAKALWLTNCSECHGKDGRGKTDQGKKLKITDLTNPQVQASFSDELAFRVIKLGLKDDRGTVMHPTSYRLTDDEARGLVTYLRGFAKK